MAIAYTIAKHAWVYPSNMLASKGGKHLYNIVLTANMDNGTIVARNNYKELDLYDHKASTGVAAVVRDQAANGNYVVEITAAGDGIMLYKEPVIAEEYNREFMDEENFFNESGDVVKGYELAVGDRIEVSVLGFDAEPEKGDALTVGTDFKWKTPTKEQGS